MKWNKDHSAYAGCNKEVITFTVTPLFTTGITMIHTYRASRAVNNEFHIVFARNNVLG